MEGDEGFEGALDYFPNTFTPKKIQPEYSGEMIVTCTFKWELVYKSEVEQI